MGIYRGIEKVVVDKVEKDYIKIEYSGGSNLYVLATQLDSIQKFSGPDGHKPKLNKLGTVEWSKTKAKVKSAVAGIAKELQYQEKTQTEHVKLYAGVPLTLFGAERKEFRDYLWHKERISFTFEGVHYSIFIDKVKIYAQCYAAIANRMGDLDRLRCVDLGSWTLDVLSVRDRIPMDKDAYTYELGLITAIERIKKDALPKLKCEIPEDDIIDVIRGKQSNVNAEFVPFVEKGLQQYADEVEAKLREIKVDLLHENIVYVGGGACVMKRFGRTQGRTYSM